MVDRSLDQPVACQIEFAGCDGARLAGTLTLPRGRSQFPVVVAAHAAGGETDRWVPIKPSIEAWRTALDRGHVRLSVSRLPGCGHFPTLATDPADLDEAGPISPAYEQLLADWLRAAALPG